MTTQQPTSYRLLAELEAAYDRLVESTAHLYDSWQRHPGEIWSLNHEPATGVWLHDALFDYWYQDGQDGRATRSHVGLVAARPPVMDAIEPVNQAKTAFAALIASIRKNAPEIIPEIKAIIPFRHPALHGHLSGSGLARLHLKQCWRAVPAAPAAVQRVRMAWYVSGRSIKRLSVADAERRLMALDTDATHIRRQLRTLAGLPAGEPLAQVQTQAPLMRANLFFHEPLPSGRTRQARNVALPLFLPCADGKLPEHNRPAAKPPQTRQRARRSDQRLEDHPLLPSLRVYRYR